ncbi:MAG TPA: hypothetical protein VME67_17495 [Mycobacterium sp.]|nr:hypothetical protein [Mycobacterium sp.]HTX96495.1 hypothetical protein [Mycobacterium sp.]
MPLRNVLSFGGISSEDPAPITAELIANIARILAEGDPAAGAYNVDEVLTGIVYALRRLELELVHTNKVLAMVRNWGQAEGST